MEDYVVIIVVLLLGAAVLFLKNTKQSGSTLILRLTSYALIGMSVYLVAAVIRGYLADFSHENGH